MCMAVHHKRVFGLCSLLVGKIIVVEYLCRHSEKQDCAFNMEVEVERPLCGQKILTKLVSNSITNRRVSRAVR